MSVGVDDRSLRKQGAARLALRTRARVASIRRVVVRVHVAERSARMTVPLGMDRRVMLGARREDW